MRAKLYVACIGAVAFVAAPGLATPPDSACDADGTDRGSVETLATDLTSIAAWAEGARDLPAAPAHHREATGASIETVPPRVEYRLAASAGRTETRQAWESRMTAFIDAFNARVSEGRLDRRAAEDLVQATYGRDGADPDLVYLLEQAFRKNSARFSADAARHIRLFLCTEHDTPCE